jgi:hypothetical protein
MNHKTIIIFLFILFSCNKQAFVYKSKDGDKTEIHLASVDNNVCKKLHGNVVLNAIFVDTKESKPWSEYDIHSTLDSIKKAITWLIQQSNDNKKYVNIELVYHNNNNKIPIALDFPKKTLSETLFQRNFAAGLKAIHGWSDKIAVTAAKSLPPDTSKLITTRNTMTDKERLIARLRDICKTDNIAVVYFINNYYKNEMSIAFNINSQSEVEYAIVSFKQPSVIAHEFLHLFGAWDLYITPFEHNKEEVKRKKFAMKEFPDDIMAFAYRELDSLKISPFTKYCIGWDKTLDDRYTEMILGKNIRPVKY